MDEAKEARERGKGLMVVVVVGDGVRLEVDVGDEEVFSKLREKFSDKKSQQDDKRARPHRERRSR